MGQMMSDAAAAAARVAPLKSPGALAFSGGAGQVPLSPQPPLQWAQCQQRLLCVFMHEFSSSDV